MSKPNRVITNMSKNPWTLDSTHQQQSAAEAREMALEDEGKQARITSYKYGSRKAPRRAWNVWVIEN